jgi:hypothetical protein
MIDLVLFIVYFIGRLADIIISYYALKIPGMVELNPIGFKGAIIANIIAISSIYIILVTDANKLYLMIFLIINITANFFIITNNIIQILR